MKFFTHLTSAILLLPALILIAGTLATSFHCPELEEPGVFKQMLQMQKNLVSPHSNSFKCQAFELSSNIHDPIQMIGTKPIVTTPLLNRMTIFTCKMKPPQKYFDSPQDCFMSIPICSELINYWTRGEAGECFKNSAYHIADGKHRYVLLQNHWANTKLTPGIEDSSGFTLYLTRRLRKYLIGSALYGEMYLNLPPGQKSVPIKHTCPSVCTSSNTQDIRGVRYIIAAAVHMHLYGYSGRISQWRRGIKVRELFPLQSTSLYTQKMIRFDPPVEFRNGDEIKTECYFNTVKASTVVRWGFRQNEEMCLGFLLYYPSSVNSPVDIRMDSCLGYGGISDCIHRMGILNVVEGECDVTGMIRGSMASDVYQKMKDNNCFKENSYTCDLTCQRYLSDTLWPSNACYDPKRSLRMAVMLSTGKFLTAPDGWALAQSQTKHFINQTVYGVTRCLTGFELEFYKIPGLKYN